MPSYDVSIFSLARVQRQSCAALFFDIVSAFASILRRIAVPELPDSEEMWRRHLCNAGVSPEEADGIVDTALSIIRWGEAGASPHAVAFSQRRTDAAGLQSMAWNAHPLSFLALWRERAWRT